VIHLLPAQGSGPVSAAAGPHPAYRADIDGLRALAVGLVVLFHFFPNHLTAGFIGVDIFFVISGFLITTIVLGQLQLGRFSYTGFYVRRVNRIFPALLLVLAVNLLLGWHALVIDEFEALGKHVAASATFLSNFALWHEAGYFDNAADTKPLLHLWSLAIEEQFYIVWPVLLGLLLRGRRRFMALIALAISASFAWNLWAVRFDPTAAYYSPATRGWQLAVGGLLACAQHKGMLSRLPFGPGLRAFSGLALLAMAVALIDKGRGYPGAWALLPTLGTALLISAGMVSWVNRRLLGWRPLAAIGLISYPLYLWHWPVLIWAKLIFMTGNLSVPIRGGLIALSVLLGWLTYALFEKPVKARNNGRTALWLSLAMVCVGLTGLSFWRGALGNRMDGEDLVKVVSATKDWDYPPASFEPVVRFSDYNFYRKPGSGPGTVLFIGDSNLEQYAPRVEAVLDRQPGSPSVIFATKGGCVFSVPALAEAASDCRGKLATIDRFVHSPEVRAVVFVQAWKNAARMLDEPALAASFDARLGSIPAGKRVFVVLNMPSGLAFSPGSLLSGSRLSRLEYRPDAAQAVDARQASPVPPALDRLLRETAARHGATVLDPFDSFCAAGRCPLVDASGAPLYRDSAHLRAAHAREAAQFIDATLATDPTR
jgi:peptidoglycan/LPS O-acetylase OafA/YrhL